MIGLALVSASACSPRRSTRRSTTSWTSSSPPTSWCRAANFLPFPPQSATRSRRSTASAVVSRQQCTGSTGAATRPVLVTGNDAAFNDIYDLDVVSGHQDLQGDEALVSKEFAEDHDLEVGSRR